MCFIYRSMSMIDSPHPQASNILSAFLILLFLFHFGWHRHTQRQRISLCYYSTIRSCWNWKRFSCAPKACRALHVFALFNLALEASKKNLLSALETGSGKYVQIKICLSFLARIEWLQQNSTSSRTHGRRFNSLECRNREFPPKVIFNF